MEIDFRADSPFILCEQGETALESFQELRSGVVDIIKFPIVSEGFRVFPGFVGEVGCHGRRPAPVKPEIDSGKE